MKLVIEIGSPGDEASWLALRRELWPECDMEHHMKEIAAIFRSPERNAVFLAQVVEGVAAGFAEVSIRREFVNGAGEPPVGFIEGLYVAPSSRCRGVARALVSAAERWVASKGCGVLASDVSLDNASGLRTHRALGFDETERVVFFRKHV